MKTPSGTWHCHTIDQFQSDESRAHGVHPDADDDAPPTPAHETEFRGVTLELAPGGRYAIRGPSLEISSGTWTLAGSSLALSEDPDQPRYFETLRRVETSAKRVRVEFTLVPDAHDGLDVMALEFQSKPPKAPKTTKPTPGGVLDAMVAGTWGDEQQSTLYALPETERLAIHRTAWDRFVAGTFASDASAGSYYEQIAFLCEGAQLEPPAPSHRHLAHAMSTLDDDARNRFSNAVATALVRLPVSDDDLLVAAAMGPAWLDVMAFYRFSAASRTRGIARSSRSPRSMTRAARTWCARRRSSPPTSTTRCGCWRDGPSFRPCSCGTTATARSVDRTC